MLENIDDERDLRVRFFKRNGRTNSFVFSKEEAASFPIDDLCSVMPKPHRQGITKRAAEIFSFKVNLGDSKCLIDCTFLRVFVGCKIALHAKSTLFASIFYIHLNYNIYIFDLLQSFNYSVSHH